MRGEAPERGGKLSPTWPASTCAHLDLTQTYTWPITTPICSRSQSAGAFTRTNTRAQRGADQNSLASCAARRIAHTRRAQCPEHIMHAPFHAPAHHPAPLKHTQRMTPSPSHASSPHMDPAGAQARPSPTQATQPTTLTVLPLYTHTPAVHCRSICCTKIP